MITNLSLALPASKVLTAFLGSSVASSSGSGGESHSISEDNGNMDVDSQKSNPALPVFAFDPSKGCFVPKSSFGALPEELKVSTVSPNGNNKFWLSKLLPLLWPVV